MIRIVCVVWLVCVLSMSAAVATGQEALQPPGSSKQHVKTLLFFGDSLTAGYGLAPAQAFPALIQEKITLRGWPMQVINAGLSGDTTAGGLRRLDWVLQRPIDVLILALGANDGLRGLPITEAKRNLQAIIDRTKSKYPQAKIVLAGMQMPANLGRDYTTRFRGIYPELAAANDTALIPFLLTGVAGMPTLNLPDGIHPTAAGHHIIAENVWQILEGVLQSLQAP